MTGALAAELNVAYITYADKENREHSFLMYHRDNNRIDPKDMKEMHNDLMKLGLSPKQVHLDFDTGCFDFGCLVLEFLESRCLLSIQLGN